MKNKYSFFIKGFCLLGIICLCILGINKILIPKFFYDDDWPTSATYIGFYEMKENTVDVIFLGSSHAVAAFSPQELYNQEGIRSYSLACEQQNMLVSYYWLREALKYQNPQVVILETRMLFDFFYDEIMNTTEECTRKALDYMKWSGNKWKAVGDICKIDKEQSIESFLLPNIRYHERWESLNENDFSVGEMGSHYELKGQSVMSWHTAGTEYKTFVAGESQGHREMHQFNKKYLDKIVELCRENSISLILVKAPYRANSIDCYNTINEYADSKGIEYIDFNEQKLYESINYDYQNDNADTDHVALSGTQKITCYLGEVLKDKYNLNSYVDEQWESTRDYYQGVIKDSYLTNIGDLKQYLSALKDERYTVFIESRDADKREYIMEIAANDIETLGLNKEFWKQDASKFYIATINAGEVREECEAVFIVDRGTMRNNRGRYAITNGDGTGSVEIDGREYSFKSSCLNIVVYNNVKKRVIDSVGIDFENMEVIFTR